MHICFVFLKIKVLYISVLQAYWKPNHCYYRLEQQVLRADLTNEYVVIVFCIGFSF